MALTSLDPMLPACVHSCISCKLYFHFKVDGASGIVEEEELSSDEDLTPRPSTTPLQQSERLLQRSQTHGDNNPSPSSSLIVHPPMPPLDSNAHSPTPTTTPLQ